MAYKVPKSESILNRWDHEHVIGRDNSRVGQHTAQSIVDYVWRETDMPHGGPRVQVLGREDVGYVEKSLAHISLDGTTMTLQRPELPTSVILHELAHAVTDDPLAYMERRHIREVAEHGPLWLTNYLWLLNRFMGPLYNTFYLRSTLPPEIKEWNLGFGLRTWANS